MYHEGDYYLKAPRTVTASLASNSLNKTEMTNVNRNNTSDLPVLLESFSNLYFTLKMVIFNVLQEPLSSSNYRSYE